MKLGCSRKDLNQRNKQQSESVLTKSLFRAWLCIASSLRRISDMGILLLSARAAQCQAGICAKIVEIPQTIKL